MKKIFIISLLMLVFIIIGCASNCKTTNNLNANVLSGVLYVAGNEPFTFLAFAANDEDNSIFKIECGDSLHKELWQLQGKTVELNYQEIKEFEKFHIVVIDGYTIREQEEK